MPRIARTPADRNHWKQFIESQLTYFTEQSDDAHRQVYGGEQHHEAKFSHELIAGAASFAGMKAWEDHQRKEGMSTPTFYP